MKHLYVSYHFRKTSGFSGIGFILLDRESEPDSAKDISALIKEIKDETYDEFCTISPIWWQLLNKYDEGY